MRCRKWSLKRARWAMNRSGRWRGFKMLSLRSRSSWEDSPTNRNHRRTFPKMFKSHRWTRTNKWNSACNKNARPKQDKISSKTFRSTTKNKASHKFKLNASRSRDFMERKIRFKPTITNKFKWKWLSLKGQNPRLRKKKIFSPWWENDRKTICRQSRNAILQNSNKAIRSKDNDRSQLTEGR